MRVLFAIVLAVCGICLFAEQDNAVNLLPGNDFKLTADSLIPEGWTGNFGKGASIQQDPAGNFLRLVNENPDDSVSAGIRTPIRILPDMERIVVTGRVNVPKVVPGSESWHDARIALTFKRADGTAMHAAIAWSSPTNGWVDFKKEFSLPGDAVEFGFTPAIFKARAELELRDLRLYAIKEIKDPVSWNLDDAWRINTGTRERICLNGVWNIRLMPGASMNENVKSQGFLRQPDIVKTLAGASSWTQIRVPGQWYSNDWMHYTRDESLLYTKGNRGPETGVCGQVKLDGKPIKELCCAWYEREFKLPENWSASNSFLKFDGFDFDGWIYLNNSLAAYQEGDVSREIPLPAGLRPGDTVKLNVLVCAEVSGMEQIVMGGGESYLITRKKESLSRGITGNVWLLRRPDVRAEDIRISSSTRENLLKVRFQLPGREALKGGRIELEVSNWSDLKPVKLFKADVEKASVLPDSELEFSFPWTDAHRWSPDDPFLYSAKLRLYRADGSVADESEPLRFGFREIWIDGKDYYLNGAPLHFLRFIDFSVPKDAARLFRYYRELGYNSIHIFPVLQPGPLLEAADETGMLVMLQLPSVSEYNKIWEKGGRRKWQSKTMTVMRESWNNPSVVSWEMNFNLLGYALDMFPESLGIETKRTFGPIGDIVKESEKMVTAQDSSRPLLHHACGSMGPVHTSNIYLNFVQPQEKYEWLLDFKNRAVKPFFAVELGMPYLCTYYYGRLGFGAVMATEPLLAEYAAMYMGEKAFASTASLLNKVAAAKVECGASNGADKYSPQINLDNEEVYIQTQSDLAEFIKYWRASGASGLHPWATCIRSERKTSGIPASYASLKTPGIKTLFSYEEQMSCPPALHELYKEIFSPLRGFIGGPSAVFTERRRNYSAGDNISKSVVIINDSAKDYSGEIQVKLLSADAKILADKTIAASVPKGRTGMFDFSFIAPECSVKSRLKLEMTSADGAIKDAFDIQALPKESEKNLADKLHRKIWLLDARGITGTALSGMGVNYVPYRGEKLGPGDLIVIGRESAEACVPFAKAIHESAMTGANVLIMEQTEKDLARHFGLRAFAASSRKLFTGAACAKMLPGFEDSDFIDWAGKATILKECPNPYSESYPVHIWKRSNGGIVASVVIEKPQTGRFIPLLHEGFNLNYTPLMLDYCGKGSLIFCQLDLNGRSKADPVAESLYRRILQLADSLTAPPCGRLVYSGGDAGKALLTHMGVDFKVSDTPGDAGLWVIGENAKAMEASGVSAVRDFLEKGGKVVFLNHNSPAASAAKLGAKCADWPMAGFAVPVVNMGDMTSGLTAADWYWKDKAKLKLPEEAFPLKEFQIGKGCLLICQLDPMQFGKEEMNQRRFAARLKMFRCLSSVLAAKGASWTETSLDSLTGVGQSVFDLAGEWNFRTDPENIGDRSGWAGTAWSGGFRHLNVPGSWESQGITDANPHYKNSEMPYDGNAWYQYQLHLGKELKGKELYLEIGAVDDYDWTYFNGRLIGKTGRETPGWYAAKRLYKIPQDTVKFGATNLIAVKVMDDYMSGGIVSGPVKVFVKKDKEEFPYLEGGDYPRHDPYLFQRW